MSEDNKEDKKLGRPLSSTSELPKGWQKEIINLYKKGASNVEVKSLIHEWRGSFSNDLWDRWIKEDIIFSETIKTGKVFSEAWWTKKGRTELENKDFSYTGWYMNMKNRFRWTDRVDQTTQGDKVSQITTFELPDNKRE